MRPAPQVRPASAGGAPVPPVPVDERILARRRQVAAEAVRRRTRRLLWLAGPLALVVALVAATRTPLLDVDHLEVGVATGRAAGARAGAAGELTDDELAAVHEALADAGIVAGAPLVDVDLARGEAALEALPWVARAEVDRHWPGTVRVDVERRVPVGAIATGGGAALVDRSGQVVAVVAGATPDLVQVEGPPDLGPGDRVEADDLLAVAERMPEALLPFVARVGPGDGDAVVLHLRDGGVVDLGPPLGAGDVADKLHAAVTMLTQVDRTCLEVLDVSVPTVPTVTRTPGC